MKNKNSKEEIEKAKIKLIDIYITMKKKINEDYNNEINIESCQKNLLKLDLLNLIEYIKSSIDIIMKMNIKYEKKDENDFKNNYYDEDYESLLRREEAWIRKHIGIENQLKLDYNLLLEKYKECEKDNKILVYQIVIILFIFFRKN